MDIKQSIIDNLTIMLNIAKNGNTVQDGFRIKAYQQAIKNIAAFNEPITEQSISSIKLGAKIKEKVLEIIRTGSLHQVNNMDNTEYNKIVLLEQFSKIWGVGPKKAQILYDAGAKSIDDIRKRFTHLLNANQIKGLKHYDDLQKRISIDKVAEIEKAIEPIILQYQRDNNVNLRYRVCGSYRRKQPTCGDMDILFCEKDNKIVLADIVKLLLDKDILSDTLGLGKTKYLGLSIMPGIAFRIDFEVVKTEEWPFALLYFTGSGTFNEKQRYIAKQMGYRLSEHGLYSLKDKAYVKGITSEKEIFDFLGMEYLEPWNRK
jgi:DNA polymerase/3'-5' exonuclease PolX